MNVSLTWNGQQRYKTNTSSTLAYESKQLVIKTKNGQNGVGICFRVPVLLLKTVPVSVMVDLDFQPKGI